MKKGAVRSHLKNFANVNTPSIIEKFGQLLEMLLKIIYGMSETIAYGKYGMVNTFAAYSSKVPQVFDIE
jgi:hypothetical protein